MKTGRAKIPVGTIKGRRFRNAKRAEGAVRQEIYLPAATCEAIDAFRDGHRIASRPEAVRRLCHLGLKANELLANRNETAKQTRGSVRAGTVSVEEAHAAVADNDIVITTHAADLRERISPVRSDAPPGEGETWNRSLQTGACARVLWQLWNAADDGMVRVDLARLSEMAGVSPPRLIEIIETLIAVKEIRPIRQEHGATGSGHAVFLLTPRQAVAPQRGRRRRKPRAQTVLFKNVFTTAVLVPRATNVLVARFQDVVWQLEPALQTRPNVGSTAGWLLREGVRFASRNRVHGLGLEPEALAEDYVKLNIYVDRRTWGAIKSAVVMSGKVLTTIVPRLIELGAQMCPLPEAGADRETKTVIPRRQVAKRRRVVRVVPPGPLLPDDLIFRRHADGTEDTISVRRLAVEIARRNATKGVGNEI